ncbi:MAG: hypothetical protein PF436_09635 [Prolixibacteraceae bacterium]|nr:hypothetical protein [Prolixibacteraceae bacterium]
MFYVPKFPLYFDRLFYFTLGIVKNKNNAEELVQDVFVKIWQYQQAVDVVNVLRRRAEWTEGEDRAFHQDGCQAAADSDDPASGYSNRNSYYESTNIAETTADNIDAHHELRPIPQSFIDGLLNEDGTNLTQEELDKMQNPGY